MLKVKISGAGYPSTLIKDKNGFSSISKFLPNGKNIWKNCQFFINEEIENPDYWIIIDDINHKIESTKISRDKVFFLAAETPFITSYFDDTKFLSQFSKIFSPHAIYNHNNHHASLPFQLFMINAAHGLSIFEYDPIFNYDKLLQNNEINKTKTLSVIASNKGSSSYHFTEFHKIRYLFAQKLKEYFKDKLDLYGFGYNEIKTKAEAIIPYKYHICLENQSTPNVITEKLYDSFLGLSYPIYWGAPNVNDYFSKDSLTQINIFDFKGTVEKIEKTIEENLFEKNFNSLIQAKNDVLNKYGVFQRIAEICENDNKQNGTKSHLEQVTVISRDVCSGKKKQKKIEKIKKRVSLFLKYGVSSVLVFIAIVAAFMAFTN